MTVQNDTPAKPLMDLQVGDKVIIKRSPDALSHDPTLAEDIGFGEVRERRDVTEVPGWGGREAHSLLRLANGVWYDADHGLEMGSKATRIVPA